MQCVWQNLIRGGYLGLSVTWYGRIWSFLTRQQKRTCFTFALTSNGKQNKKTKLSPVWLLEAQLTGISWLNLINAWTVEVEKVHMKHFCYDHMHFGIRKGAQLGVTMINSLLLLNSWGLLHTQGTCWPLFYSVTATIRDFIKTHTFSLLLNTNPQLQYYHYLLQLVIGCFTNCQLVFYDSLTGPM